MNKLSRDASSVNLQSITPTNFISIIVLANREIMTIPLGVLLSRTAR
jgi:hypothetical protein